MPLNNLLTQIDFKNWLWEYSNETRHAFISILLWMVYSM